MRITVLHNRDHQLLEVDPGREARKDVERVAAILAEALAQRGVGAELVAVEDDLPQVLHSLRKRRPDLVVNLCESIAADSRGEMAVPCLLELLGLPFTGSGALALGLALHKDKAKDLLRARGVPTPESFLVERLGDLAGREPPFPVIVKPVREDASAGIHFGSVVGERGALGEAVARVLRDFRQPVLVERYVEGREIYVPLLGNQPRRALPLTEIRFGEAFAGKPRIVSYRAKWEAASPECRDSEPVPCSLEPALLAKVETTALSAFEALGCRDYGRVDIRLSPQGEPFVIDINPNCDLHPEAGFARAALAAGISYPELAMKLVEIALERNHGNSSTRAARPRAARRAAAPDRNLLPARGGLRPRAHRPRAHAEQP